MYLIRRVITVIFLRLLRKMLCEVTTLIIRLEKVRLSKTLCGEKRRVQEIETKTKQQNKKTKKKTKKKKKKKTFNFE